MYLAAHLSFVTLLFYAAGLFYLVSGQDRSTACVDSGSDWYTQVVGETPCATYQQLNQICNPKYNLNSFNATPTPGDRCDQQFANCCCNSISFALSMLCLTCKKGIGSHGYGVDAEKGTYETYLTIPGKNSFCSPNLNRSLPNDIQNDVCNQNIKIPDNLYTLFWPDGAWFYAYTRDNINNSSISGESIFTKCNNNVSTYTSVSAESSNTLSTGQSTGQPISIPSDISTVNTTPKPTSIVASASNNANKTSKGTIIGAVIGTLGIFTLSSVVIWLLWRQQKQINAEKQLEFSPDRMFANKGGVLRPNPSVPVPPVTGESSM